MPKHHILEGRLETAQLAALEGGGQLFPARDDEGPFVLVCGSRISTFWPKDSRRHGMVQTIASQLGYDPHIATTGRIIRWLVDDILALNYKDTYFCQKWRGLAINGSHWHYQYVKPGTYEYAMEVDLKSAYWAAFASQPTCLLNQHKAFIDDNGALESLNNIIKTLPKSFRLALLGTFSSWRQSYFTRKPNDKGGKELIFKRRNNIKYGGLFNATHRAILKVYKVMEVLHKICGDDVIRIHTDGILLDCTNGMKWEAQLEDFIHKQGFDYTIKSNGSAWIDNINCGIVGNKCIGSKQIVADKMRTSGATLKRNPEAPDLGRFAAGLPPSPCPQIRMNPATIYTQTALPLTADDGLYL